MSENPFKRLTAYRTSLALGREVRASVRRWSSLDRWTVGVQLIRSIDSVGANIAEGAGRAHARDKKQFLVVARGSLYETEHWVTVATDRGLLTDDYEEAISEIRRSLSGLIRRL